MGKRRVSVQLDDAAMLRLNELASERKKGEFLSALILQDAAPPPAPASSGILERIEARLARIERQLEQMAARR